MQRHPRMKLIIRSKSIFLFADSVVQRSPRMSGAKADAELRSKTDNLERMITEVEKLMTVLVMVMLVMLVVVVMVIMMVIKSDNLERMITKVEKLSGSDSGSNGIGGGREVKKYIRWVSRNFEKQATVHF